MPRAVRFVSCQNSIVVATSYASLNLWQDGKIVSSQTAKPAFCRGLPTVPREFFLKDLPVSLRKPLSLLLRSYLRFRLRSGNAHGLHSPFVFQLYTQVIRNRQLYYCYEPIEDSRLDLLRSVEILEMTDLGAGSKTTAARQRKVRDIARHSEKSAALAQLLFRLAHHFQPQTILDLGTSLGTTTLYLAHANRQARVFTFEGDRGSLEIARRRFGEFGLSNIIPVAGNIDRTLPETLANIEKLDFVFFDANHRLEPTLRYFEQCLAQAHPDSVFVFDDIYWSAEMRRAWQSIQAHPSVTMTVDLFHLGLVFFRESQLKQHFSLRI